MMNFLKAFGSMILTIVGIVTALTSFFFVEDVNVFQSLLTFGMWFLFIPKLALSNENYVNIAYLVRNKDYAEAMFVLFFKIMLLGFCPLLALLFICDSAILVWAITICVGVGILSLVECLLILFVNSICSMYKDAVKKYKEAKEQH